MCKDLCKFAKKKRYSNSLREIDFIHIEANAIHKVCVMPPLLELIDSENLTKRTYVLNAKEVSDLLNAGEKKALNLAVEIMRKQTILRAPYANVIQDMNSLRAIVHEFSKCRLYKFYGFHLKLEGELTTTVKIPFRQLKYLLVLAARGCLVEEIKKKIVKNYSYFTTPSYSSDYSVNTAELEGKQKFQ
eukprot:TRINITY_DN5700_c0_g1_i3.p2 TRINITY_DN5700_c0_g1~~TRINITY_DN5700_c0_g1_i3.p2  ORF type:complete len:188 (-),score=31.98 TRINITY_DN5700_c0_g1_i3:316-879(-)